ncbi:MAG TPA: hypothetical protein VK633_02825, partial [Verrucomicrobiae bacterium]|nr:hypothetical protein [Verrucomicrobiae bacterium]
ILFDQETLFARRIRWKGQEFILAIYGAVRDRHWNTIKPVLKTLEVNSIPGAFSLKFSAECLCEEIQYTWNGSIRGDAQGEFRYEFSGQAQSDFLRNRIGLCVLHPLPLCVGANALIEHPDGTRETATFPEQVAPFQPIQEIRAIEYDIGSGAAVAIRFEGEIFEMEDQRNWTDSSFKTYSTPLRIPLPAAVKKGDRVQQTVSFQIKDSIVEAGRGTLAVPHENAQPISIPLSIEFGAGRVKPRVGFGVSPISLSRQSVEWAHALQADHLRVDCHFEEPDWNSKLVQADAQANSIGAGLHIGVFLSRDKERNLSELAGAIRDLRSAVKLWLIYDDTENCTRPATVAQAQKILGTNPTNFAAGTNRYFADLNRDRPPADANWFPCFSINPQVHASDSLSMLENVDAQSDVLIAASTFAAQLIVVSPVTLRPRNDPRAPDSVRAGNLSDPRQTSLFAARWTLGSLAALTSPNRAHSLTYFELAGPGGLMCAEEPFLYPVYFVFKGLAQMAQLATLERLAPEHQRCLSALAGTDAAGQKIIWLANHTSKQLEVQLTRQTGARLRLEFFQELDFSEAHREPGHPFSPAALEYFTNSIIQLPPFALAKASILERKV